MLTKIQYRSFLGWPPRRLAVFVRVMELDDSRKHHVCRLSSQCEVRPLSLADVYGLTSPSGWLGLLVVDDITMAR
jgi:hypothetical protein